LEPVLGYFFELLVDQRVGVLRSVVPMQSVRMRTIARCETVQVNDCLVRDFDRLELQGLINRQPAFCREIHACRTSVPAAVFKIGAYGITEILIRCDGITACKRNRTL